MVENSNILEQLRRNMDEVHAALKDTDKDIYVDRRGTIYTEAGEGRQRVPNTIVARFLLSVY